MGLLGGGLRGAGLCLYGAWAGVTPRPRVRTGGTVGPRAGVRLSFDAALSPVSFDAPSSEVTDLLASRLTHFRFAARSQVTRPSQRDWGSRRWGTLATGVSMPRLDALLLVVLTDCSLARSQCSRSLARAAAAAQLALARARCRRAAAFLPPAAAAAAAQLAVPPPPSCGHALCTPLRSCSPAPLAAAAVPPRRARAAPDCSCRCPLPPLLPRSKA